MGFGRSGNHFPLLKGEKWLPSGYPLVSFCLINRTAKRIPLLSLTQRERMYLHVHSFTTSLFHKLVTAWNHRHPWRYWRCTSMYTFGRRVCSRKLAFAWNHGHPWRYWQDIRGVKQNRLCFYKLEGLFSAAKIAQLKNTAKFDYANLRIVCAFLGWCLTKAQEFDSFKIWRFLQLSNL